MFDRWIKPILVALIMFFSIHTITGRGSVALACAILPLVLGMLRIMTGVAYSLTALALIAAIVSYAAPDVLSRDDIDHAMNWAKEQLSTMEHRPAGAKPPATPPKDKE